MNVSIVFSLFPPHGFPGLSNFIIIVSTHSSLLAPHYFPRSLHG
jgi:hypothetical protein